MGTLGFSEPEVPYEVKRTIANLLTRNIPGQDIVFYDMQENEVAQSLTKLLVNKIEPVREDICDALTKAAQIISDMININQNQTCCMAEILDKASTHGELFRNAVKAVGNYSKPKELVERYHLTCAVVNAARALCKNNLI